MRSFNVVKLVTGLLLAFCLMVNAEIPLSEKTSEDVLSNRARIKQQISTGVTALETGLPSIAARIIAQVLKDLPEGDSRAEDLRLKWVTALLAIGKFEEAEKAMAVELGLDQPMWVLRRAMLDLALGRRDAAAGHLAVVGLAALPKGEHCWVFYVRGLLKWDSGEQDAGLELMQKADAHKQP